MRIGLALGSNVGDRINNLHRARKAIEQLPGVTSPILASAIYATAPVDCEEDAREFLNAVLEVDYDGDPRVLLPELKAAETSLGRPANHARNVSRSIDIDLLYADDMEVRDERLEVPHPRMLSRRFVLQPLADIRPDLILPGQNKAVNELLALLPESGKVVRLTNDWGTQ
jgi:2-amino-4-hydroxy-6-hydroxymethyldihydropteridine diphosphokinase